nr:MarR family transcriptional regulator [uncultured Sulfurimonas sp.]
MKKNIADYDLINNFYEKIALKELPEIFSLTFPIALIHKTIFSNLESFLKEHYDLLNSEIDVLALLYTHDNVLSPTQLYDMTVFSSGGMTKVLKRLQERALILRKENPADKRCMLVCLTQEGEELVIKSLKEVSKMCSKYFEVLSDKEMQTLSILLKKILLNPSY